MIPVFDAVIYCHRLDPPKIHGHIQMDSLLLTDTDTDNAHLKIIGFAKSNHNRGVNESPGFIAPE